MKNNKKIILGLAAELAGGKGTIAKHIVEKYQGNSYRFSTILRDILDRLYLGHFRENMQKLSTMLRQGFGEDVLARVMAEDVKNDNHQVIAVDGIRRLEDIKYLKEIPGFKFIYIDADIKIRHERMTRRGENPDDSTKTFEQFQKDQQGEADVLIPKLKKFADYVVDNNGNLEELHKQINEIIAKQ